MNKIFLPINVLLLFCLCACALSENSSPAEIQEKQWIESVKQSAIPIDSLDRDTFDPSTLSFLDPLLEGKRIVYLGEPDHYIHEKYDYRLMFIDYLYKKGWRHIGMEMGRSDGHRVDRFLETGDVSHLGRLGLYGYKEDLRSDRDDLAKLSPGLRQQKFWDNFLSEEYWFLQQLFLLGTASDGADQRIRWFGYDIDTWPGGGYSDCLEWTQENSENPIIKDLRSRIARVAGESREEETTRLRGVLEFVQKERAALKESLGEAAAIELERTIHCLLDSMIFMTSAWEGRNSSSWIDAFVTREKTMFRQVEEILVDLPQDAKIILLGHNMHLSKDHRTLGYPNYYPMWTTLGSYLFSRYPDEIISIWMLYDHGRHASLELEDVYEEVKSHPWRIEQILRKAGSLYLLPIHNDGLEENYLSQNRYFGVNGRLGKGILKNQMDVLFFIDKVNAIKKR